MEVKSNTAIDSHQCGALKEVGMGAKKQQAQSEDYREKYREEQCEPAEFEVPEEMETWALDDLSDLVPTIFD
jgi:hypothetical protein